MTRLSSIRFHAFELLAATHRAQTFLIDNKGMRVLFVCKHVSELIGSKRKHEIRAQNDMQSFCSNNNMPRAASWAVLTKMSYLKRFQMLYMYFLAS